MVLFRHRLTEVASALSDPTRREIWEYVLSADDPPSVREVAERFGLHGNAARLHLEKLVQSGLLYSTRRRGSRGGRPAHLYRAVTEGEEFNLPPRRYKLLAEVLAAAWEEEAGRMELLEYISFTRGREEAGPHAAVPGGVVDAEEVLSRWLESLRERGLFAKAWRREDGTPALKFRLCPFGDLSSRYAEITCRLHRSYEEGVLSLWGPWRLKPLAESCSFLLVRATADGGEDFPGDGTRGDPAS